MPRSLSIKPSYAAKVITYLEDFCRLALMDDIGLTADEADARIQAELDYYRQLKLEDLSIADIYHRFCNSLANRDRLWNLIYGKRFDELDVAYGSILADYEPKSVVSKFQNQVDFLLSELLEVRHLPCDKLESQQTHPRSQFRLFASGLLAGAKYFANFANGLVFKESLEEWLCDPTKAANLPYHFHNLGLPGFGPALASDFLKEVGVKELGKPDRWVYRCMTAAGWITATSSESEIQMVFWNIWKLLGTDYPPVITDKLMFLVGSGSYVMVEPVYSCESRFDSFEARLRN